MGVDIEAGPVTTLMDNKVAEEQGNQKVSRGGGDLLVDLQTSEHFCKDFLPEDLQILSSFLRQLEQSQIGENDCE